MKFSLSRALCTPLLLPGPALGPENLDKKSLILKTKVAEFPNFLKQKICIVTSEHWKDTENLGILAQLG